MTIEEVPLSGPIEKKITWAETRYIEIRDQFLGDERIADHLKIFKEAARASHGEMVASGVVDECKACEETEGGSCCGAGLENRYSTVLILINLLLGEKIPHKRLYPSACFFLGPQGCRLLARHVICVNYLCKKITDRIDPVKMAALREKEGAELKYLFLLNERIKKVLKDY